MHDDSHTPCLVPRLCPQPPFDQGASRSQGSFEGIGSASRGFSGIVSTVFFQIQRTS